MNHAQQPFPWPDPDFEKHREQIPLEELRPYDGQHVAYSWDGRRVLDGDADETRLFEKLKERGIDTNRVVFSYVDFCGGRS